MSYVTDTLKAPIDTVTHSDPLAETLTGNQVTTNPDEAFRHGLSAQQQDDRPAQSIGIGRDDYMHTGELVGALAALFFGGEAALGAAGSGGGAGAADAGVAAGGDAGAATAGGGAATASGGGAVVGDAGVADTVGATGTAGLGDAAAAGGGDAGAATAGGGASVEGSSAASTSAGGTSLLHKAATYTSLFNAANSLINAKKSADAAAQNQAGAPPPPTQAPNDPDMSAIRKKNSLLFGDDSPSSTDLTAGKADQGNLGKVSLLGGTKKLGG